MFVRTVAHRSTADSAMLRYRKASGIIISGESGAGKTEAARQVLAYVARVSGAYLAASSAQKQHHHGKHGAKKVVLPPPKLDKAAEIALKVKDRLITSTVVTEAFGNSMTTRNDK
jgi:myosin heavy subunit